MVVMAPQVSFSFATLNVRGLASKKKQSQVYRLLLEENLDVLAVQETKVEGEEETGSMVLKFTSRYFATVSQAIGTSGGCVLFVRKLPGLVIENVFSCSSGRVVWCDIVYCDTEWRIICVYAPTIGQERSGFFFQFTTTYVYW